MDLTGLRVYRRYLSCIDKHVDRLGRRTTQETCNLCLDLVLTWSSPRIIGLYLENYPHVLSGNLHRTNHHLIMHHTQLQTDEHKWAGYRTLGWAAGVGRRPWRE